MRRRSRRQDPARLVHRHQAGRAPDRRRHPWRTCRAEPAPGPRQERRDHRIRAAPGPAGPGRVDGRLRRAAHPARPRPLPRRGQERAPHQRSSRTTTRSFTPSSSDCRGPRSRLATTPANELTAVTRSAAQRPPRYPADCVSRTLSRPSRSPVAGATTTPRKSRSSGSTRSPPTPRTPRPMLNSPRPYGSTGTSRPTTTSATPPSPRTPRRSVPAAHPARWPPFATSPSPWPASPAGPIPQKPPTTTGHTPITHSTSSGPPGERTRPGCGSPIAHRRYCRSAAPRTASTTTSGTRRGERGAQKLADDDSEKAASLFTGAKPLSMSRETRRGLVPHVLSVGGNPENPAPLEARRAHRRRSNTRPRSLPLPVVHPCGPSDLGDQGMRHGGNLVRHAFLLASGAVGTFQRDAPPSEDRRPAQRSGVRRPGTVLRPGGATHRTFPHLVRGHRRERAAPGTRVGMAGRSSTVSAMPRLRCCGRPVRFWSCTPLCAAWRPRSIV